MPTLKEQELYGKGLIYTAIISVPLLLGIIGYGVYSFINQNKENIKVEQVEEIDSNTKTIDALIENKDY